MRLYTAFTVLLLAVSVLAAAQTVVPKTKAIDDIEDVEIGMSADTVISALAKNGYTLVDAFKMGDPTQWNVSLQDKYVGSFDVEKGQVTGVEVPVYTGQDSIDFGDALYWILYDNGQTAPSTHRDWMQASTDAHFTTREIEMRTPGSSRRMIFVNIANGANYRISLGRSDGKQPSVSVVKLAPFVPKK